MKLNFLHSLNVIENWWEKGKLEESDLSKTQD